MKVYKVVKIGNKHLTSLDVLGTRTRLSYEEGKVTASPRDEVGIWCYSELSEAMMLKRFVGDGGDELEIRRAVGIGNPLKRPSTCSRDSLGNPVLRFRRIRLGKLVKLPC